MTLITGEVVAKCSLKIQLSCANEKRNRKSSKSEVVLADIMAPVSRNKTCICNKNERLMIAMGVIRSPDGNGETIQWLLEKRVKEWGRNLVAQVAPLRRHCLHRALRTKGNIFYINWLHAAKELVEFKLIHCEIFSSLCIIFRAKFSFKNCKISGWQKRLCHELIHSL